MSFFPYSGQNQPPLFGDYEAQRHWMEITVNLPVKEWYFNSTANDLMYWGLDYPPLTAYHSLVCGYIARLINPDYVSHASSRGYESYEHKLFMRLTVLVSDFLVIFPALWWFYSNKTVIQQYRLSFTNKVSKVSPSPDETLSLFVSLIYPGLILIDYGHFQYNGISLGFFVAAVAALYRENLYGASFLFCLALNFKQMELYHALPFFCYILGKCVSNDCFNIRGMLKLFSIGLVVITTFTLVWFPFLSNFNVINQVVRRIFPLSRGVFEDKVANFWCVLNIVYKLKTSFSNASMAKICLVVTSLTILPSSIDLFLHPNLKKFSLSIINISLSFFLFSFQVHEKSILLVAIPALLYFNVEPFVVFWFLLISTFSMLPLFIKDGLVIPFAALNVIFFVSVVFALDLNFSNTLRALYIRLSSLRTTKFEENEAYKNSSFKVSHTREYCAKFAFLSSILIFCVIAFLSLFIAPPERYPHLFSLVTAVYSFVHFMLFLLYFNLRQILNFNNEHVKCY